MTAADQLLHVLYCEAADHPRPPRYQLSADDHAVGLLSLIGDELVESVPGGLRLTPPGIRRGSDIDTAYRQRRGEAA